MNNKRFLWATFLVLAVLFGSCKADNDEPKNTVSGVVENIVGRWLLSSSEALNHTVFEFTETSRINVEMLQNGRSTEGSGFYSVNETNSAITGSYTDKRNQTRYIDWMVKKNRAFQIDFEQYDTQTYVGEASIYRIVGNVEINLGESVKPEYRDYTGQSGCSGFYSLDTEKVSVDETSGVISGNAEGSTFVVFDTKNGKAVLQVNVTPKAKTLAEIIVGTWVYNNHAEHECQHTRFLDDGRMSAVWSIDNIDEIAGFGSGKYTVSDNKVNFILHTEDGTQFVQEWRVEFYNDFDCTYSCYNYNEFVGKYTGHRLLHTMMMAPGQAVIPDYKSLLGDIQILDYSSHNDAIASVDASGTVRAKSKGTTYIEIKTGRGSGVVEVMVDNSILPVDFENCLGKNASAVYELLGDNHFYDSESLILYMDYTSEISMIGISLDTETGLVKGVTITYNATVNVADVTGLLGVMYIPYMKQTTDSFKAYMDTVELADASVGVTWIISDLTLNFVDLVSASH